MCHRPSPNSQSFLKGTGETKVGSYIIPQNANKYTYSMERGIPLVVGN